MGICTHCNKQFDLEKDLKRHVDTVHLGLRPFQCGQCDETFGLNATLVRHIKLRHAKSESYKCTHCDHISTTPGNLKEHIDAMHLKLQKYKCNLCTDTFTRAGGLTTHINKVHLGLKPEKCGQCDKRFANKSNLGRHINKAHLNQLHFDCEKCDKKFFSKEELTSHITCMHTPSYLLNYIVCEHDGCGMLFKLRSNMKQHVRKCHNDKPRKFIKAYEQQVFDAFKTNGLTFDYNVTLRLPDDNKDKTYHVDFIVQSNNCVLFVEVDEYAHGFNNLANKQNSKCSYYNVNCELSRMMDIVASWKTSGDDRPFSFIRYNPHGFRIDDDKVIVDSSTRLIKLVDTIKKWESRKNFELLYMYYDVYLVDGKHRCCIWDHEDYSMELEKFCREPMIA